MENIILHQCLIFLSILDFVVSESCNDYRYGYSYCRGFVLSDSCYHYTYGYSYCSGYCSGYHGSQYCIYYYGTYIFSGGAVAGLVIGLLIAASIVIIVIVVCLKNYNRRHRTVGTVIGPNTRATNIAVTTTTTHNTGFIQPTNPNPYGYAAQPPRYSAVYPPPQQGQPAYPPPSQQGPPAYPPPPQQPFQQGYSAPVLPQYDSLYNQPPQPHIPPSNA